MTTGQKVVVALMLVVTFLMSMGGCIMAADAMRRAKLAQKAAAAAYSGR